MPDASRMNDAAAIRLVIQLVRLLEGPADPASGNCDPAARCDARSGSAGPNGIMAACWLAC